jgi:hypothetical protein
MSARSQLLMLCPELRRAAPHVRALRIFRGSELQFTLSIEGLRHYTLRHTGLQSLCEYFVFRQDTASAVPYRARKINKALAAEGWFCSVLTQTLQPLRTPRTALVRTSLFFAFM